MDNPVMGYMGNGMVQNAAQALGLRNYQLYVQECQQTGQPVMPFAQWAQMQQMGQQPQAQTQAPQQGAMTQSQFGNGSLPPNRAQLLQLLQQRAMGQTPNQ